MRTNFHELNSEELNLKLNELKQELFNLRFSHATGQLSNPLQLAKCKKDIARIKTVLRERELKIERQPKAAKAPAGKKAKA